MVVTMFTMLGFINLVSTLFEPFIVDYTMAIQGGLYLFEIIATSCISTLFNVKYRGESIQLSNSEEKP